MFGRKITVGVAGLLVVAGMICAGNAQETVVDAVTHGGATPLAVLSAASYPQALPNDGLSLAEVSVEFSVDGEPVIGQEITGRVTSGDGELVLPQMQTDADGRALFSFRMGMMPEPAGIEFSCDAVDAQAEVMIPLAAVSFLDLTLVPPEEYELYLERQVNAAPIYQMEIDGFPLQLAADGASLSRLSAQLTLVDGTPAPGVPLMVELASGEGELLVDQVATDSDGYFEFEFIAGWTPGTVILNVIEPSTGLIEAIDLILVESGPARIELYYVDPFGVGGLQEGALLPADGSTALPMVAEVSDLNGIPLPGVTVALDILEMPNGWIEVLDPVSDAEGRVEFLYYAGTFAGQVRLRAYLAAGLPK